METIYVVSVEGHHALAIPESTKMTISAPVSSEVTAGDIIPPSGDAPAENKNDLKLSEPPPQETGGFSQSQRQQEKIGALDVDQQSHGSTRGFTELNCVSSSGSFSHCLDEEQQVSSNPMPQNEPEHILTPSPDNTNSGCTEMIEKDAVELRVISEENGAVKNGHNLTHSNMEDLKLTGAAPEVGHSDCLSAHPSVNGHDVVFWPHTQLLCPVPSLVALTDHSTTLSVLSSETFGPVAGQGDLPRIIKHKPSSITFADYNCPPYGDQNAPTNESSDGQESSSEDDNDAGGDDEDEGENDEDVFHELPLCPELLVGPHRRSRERERPRRRAAMTESSGSQDHISSGQQAEDDTSATKESPQVLSPWSESMSQLMRKLDQLNLDIEEALSAGSSPTDTPAAIRKHTAGHSDPRQCDSISWRSAQLTQSAGTSHTLRGLDSFGQDQGCTSTMSSGSGSATGTRTRPKKTEMSTKKRNKGTEY